MNDDQVRDAARLRGRRRRAARRARPRSAPARRPPAAPRLGLGRRRRRRRHRGGGRRGRGARRRQRRADTPVAPAGSTDGDVPHETGQVLPVCFVGDTGVGPRLFEEAHLGRRRRPPRSSTPSGARSSTRTTAAPGRPAPRCDSVHAGRGRRHRAPARRRRPHRPAGIDVRRRGADRRAAAGPHRAGRSRPSRPARRLRGRGPAVGTPARRADVSGRSPPAPTTRCSPRCSIELARRDAGPRPRPAVQPVHRDGPRRRVRGQRPVGAHAGRHRGASTGSPPPGSAARCRRTPSR